MTATRGKPSHAEKAGSRQGDRMVCPCGTPVEFDPIDGWQHADGSVSHDGEFHGKSVSDLMRTAAWEDRDGDAEAMRVKPVRAAGFKGYVGTDYYGGEGESDEDEPDHVDEHLHHFVRAHGTDAEDWKSHAPQPQRIDLRSGVYATQSHVSQQHIDKYLADPGAQTHKRNPRSKYLGDQHAMFVTHNGNLHATDGHHRVAAALQRGDTHIMGWHHDLDAHPVGSQPVYSSNGMGVVGRTSCEECQGHAGQHTAGVSDLMHVAVLGPITPASGTITGSHLPYDATYQAAGEMHYLHREPRGVHARTGEGRLSGFLGWDDQGQVGSVHVHEDYRRHGLASALWEHAKAVEPDLHHSTTLSGDGAAWARHTGVGRGDVMTRMHPRDLMPHVGDFDLDHNLVDSMRQHGWDPGKGKAFLRQRGQFHEDENPVTLWHTDRGSYVEPGNHRVPAADAAGLDSIPVLVKDRRTKPPVTARFTPDKRVFTHTDGLDHRLFDGEHLRPEVRSDVLARFTRFCAIRGYRNWSSWGRLVFFGSEASEWTSLSLEGNGDFDLSLGVDYPTFRQHNPAYDAMTDQEIAQMFTEQMHADLNDSQHFFAVTL